MCIYIINILRLYSFCITFPNIEIYRKLHTVAVYPSFSRLWGERKVKTVVEVEQLEIRNILIFLSKSSSKGPGLWKPLVYMEYILYTRSSISSVMIELQVIPAIDLSIIWITKKFRYFNKKIVSVANKPFYFLEDGAMN